MRYRNVSTSSTQALLVVAMKSILVARPVSAASPQTLLILATITLTDLFSSPTSGSVDEGALVEWSKQEAENSDQQREDELRAQYEEEIHPSRKPFHKFIVVVSFVAALAALSMGIGQVVGIVVQEVGPIQYVLRLYVLFLCLLEILVELEWPKFVRESKILHIWITRGLFYGFIGVVGLEENDTSREKNSGGFDIAREYVKAVAWIMIGVGALYSLLGIFCFQRYYNRLRADYEARLRRAPEIRQTAERYSARESNDV